jgi:LPXTG-site transpeptidase (sortase) family protein
LKPGWMIPLGLLLITVGLANSYLGVRQSFSPFDLADGSPVDAPSHHSPVLLPDTSNTPTSPPDGPVLSSQSQSASLFGEPDQTIGLIPDRLVIPSIDLDAPILPTKVKKIDFQGQTYYQWLAPDKPAVGWHDSSALLGLPGNTVLNGHHNVYGKVFKDLVKLHEGDLIQVYSGNQVFKYQVVLAMLLPERFKSLTVRLENARWILPTDDERLTLITCWPADSNTHRVIIVALPEQ